MDYLIESYLRSPKLTTCIDLLLDFGGVTRYDLPGVLDILRGRADRLSQQVDASPELVNRRFPELECGSTGARRLLLQGGTLLHVAAEYGGIESAKLLIRRGTSVNARARWTRPERVDRRRFSTP